MATISPHRHLENFLSLAWIATLALLLLDSYGNPHTSSQLLGLSSHLLSLAIIFLSLLLRLFLRVTVNHRFTRLILFLSIALVIIGLSLGLLESLTPPNHLFSLTRLHPGKLVLAGHISFLFFLFKTPAHHLSSYLPLLILFLPAWWLLLTAWIRHLPFDSFVHFTQEDGPVETFQTLIVFTTSFLALLEARLAHQNRQLSRRSIFVVLAILFFVIGMEEISWGQRIIGFETASNLKQINVQDETNLHNIGILNQLQYLVYIIVSFFGFLGLLFPATKSSLHPWQSTPLIGLYFMTPLVFYLYSLFDSRHFSWAEIIEVLFYLGLFIWVFTHSRLVKQQLPNSLKSFRYSATI